MLEFISSCRMGRPWVMSERLLGQIGVYLLKLIGVDPWATSKRLLGLGRSSHLKLLDPIGIKDHPPRTSMAAVEEDIPEYTQCISRAPFLWSDQRLLEQGLSCTLLELNHPMLGSSQQPPHWEALPNQSSTQRFYSSNWTRSKDSSHWLIEHPLDSRKMEYHSL